MLKRHSTFLSETLMAELEPAIKWAQEGNIVSLPDTGCVLINEEQAAKLNSVTEQLHFAKE